MKIENCSMGYAHTRSRSSKNEIGKKMITILGKRGVRVARNKKGKMRYIFGEIDDWHDRRCPDECRYFVL